MTPDLRVQQAIVVRDARGVRVCARSVGFDEPEAERVAVLFGDRPDGVACPVAHFACPFGKARVAVVRVEDRPGGALGFRFLVLARELYKHLGDPFAVSDRYPSQFDATGPLPDLAWPMEVLPPRTVDQLDAILKDGDGPLLLGAAQALIDGNRVALARGEPAERTLRDLWQLLPDRSRCELWPATFAFAPDLGFSVAAGPGAAVARGALPEEAVRDYPQSHYELNLQLAVESKDAAALRKLLARRTSDDTLRLGLYMLAFALVVAAVLKFAL
jgi:hypothetical protein